LNKGDSSGGAPVNLAEQLRQRRDFARAEALNLASARANPSGTALGNAVEMQLNQGKTKEAAATVERLKAVSAGYGAARVPYVEFAQGDDKAFRATIEERRRSSDPRARASGFFFARSAALLDGRLHDDVGLRHETAIDRGIGVRTDDLYDIRVDVAVTGPTPALVARLDTVIAKIPFRDMPMVDRPYLYAAGNLALAGQPAKARAMVDRYRAEMTDTSIRREREPDLHTILAEIALAENKPQVALAEFRLGDVGNDGRPANECTPCLAFNLARAYDAAGKADSAAMMFERYLATPYWLKAEVEFDPIRVPAIRERLGQLYEGLGQTDKAIAQYRAFIELWKNADPELQPRVADARQRLARLTPVEKSRP